MHLLRNLSGIFLNRLHALLRDMHGRNDTCRIPGMDARKFNMLHHGRDKGMRTIADGVRLTFQGMIQEPVYQNRSVRCHARCRIHILCHALVVINHFHASAAQHIRRTHHHRVTYTARDCKSFFHRCGHA